eukprot:GFUD01000607.1.p2 GENE.GFUD01000607.1~~GFUD01000607.1.p2  ORF type:complete len:228 (+),score=32.39 GFUD01000607.1:43-726(+)
MEGGIGVTVLVKEESDFKFDPAVSDSDRLGDLAEKDEMTGELENCKEVKHLKVDRLGVFMVKDEGTGELENSIEVEDLKLVDPYLELTSRDVTELNMSETSVCSKSKKLKKKRKRCVTKRQLLERLGKINYSCDKCEFETKFSNCLSRHDRINHRSVRYTCEVCCKEYKTPEQVKQHRLVIHEGFRFNCDSCDHKSTSKSHLRIHIQAKHEGVTFSCTECEYKGKMY